MTQSNSLMQAAIVLNSLPAQQAAQLLSRLDSVDLKRVLTAAKQLDHISAEQITDCLNQLKSDTQRFDSAALGPDTEDIEYAKLQIEKALAVEPPNLALSKKSRKPFDFLAQAIPTIRNLVLSDEHPRNIAIVLSMFEPGLASQTMKQLDPNLRISVLKRMCELDEIRDDDIIELVYALRMRYNKLVNSRQGRSAGVESAANLLSCSDAATREALLAYVSQSDPDLANTLQRSVFGIERLCQFTDSDLKTVLKNVDTSCWAPALKNASAEVIDKILNNMALAPRELLSHEIAQIGDVGSAQQDAARRNIVNAVLELSRKGKVNVQSRVPTSHVPFAVVGRTGSVSTPGMVTQK